MSASSFFEWGGVVAGYLACGFGLYTLVLLWRQSRRERAAEPKPDWSLGRGHDPAWYDDLELYRRGLCGRQEHVELTSGHAALSDGRPAQVDLSLSEREGTDVGARVFGQEAETLRPLHLDGVERERVGAGIGYLNSNSPEAATNLGLNPASDTRGLALCLTSFATPSQPEPGDGDRQRQPSGTAFQQIKPLHSGSNRELTSAVKSGARRART